MSRFDLAIVGTGANGALTAVHYARHGGRSAHGALVEAGARAARGLAYGTPYGAHLLNVPASKLSALPEDSEHFVRWLKDRGVDAKPGTFAPRALYGEYLAELLETREVRDRVQRVGGTAVGLTRGGEGWVVHLHDGRTVAARNIVLALGNLAPEDPLHLDAEAPDEYVRDPWAPGAVAGLDPDDPVLLLGSGLTALEVAVALRDAGHKGPIHAVSLHGWVPRQHGPEYPVSLLSKPFRTPREGVRWVHAQEDWRAAIDSLKPHAASIWQSWTVAERASFLRHAYELWDVHRHRASPEVLARAHLQVLTGHVVSVRPGAEVVWKPRGAEGHLTVHVKRVINCSSPAHDYARVDLPLVVHLRRAGWLVPDALRQGVETAPDGRLVGRDGKPVDGLYTLGPPRRPALWEVDGLPEVRDQAAELARRLVT